jgi:hypothetical protein
VVLSFQIYFVDVDKIRNEYKENEKQLTTTKNKMKNPSLLHPK